jgi:hypothetical protein
MKAETASIKYIFIDVVGFTKDRSVEAQSDIVEKLNEIVSHAISSNPIPEDHLIVLPSGDGLCIALIELPQPFDIHLILALDILKELDNYNANIEDKMRKFEIRIGINENIDNIIIDYNKHRNVAGAGISMAQRIMNLADGSQILIGQTVYEILQHREKYLNAFKIYQAKGKHGIEFDVYQYTLQGHNWLNIQTPSIFSPQKPVETRISKLVAYYFAHAIANKEFFIKKINRSGYEYVSIVLLYLLASDSESKSNAKEFESPSIKTWSTGNVSIDEQFEYYNKIDYWTICLLSKEISERYLGKFIYFFEKEADIFTLYAFINEKGREKLKREWPDIWEEFFGQIE